MTILDSCRDLAEGPNLKMGFEHTKWKEKWGLSVGSTVIEKWGMSIRSTVIEKWDMSVRSTVIEKWDMSLRSTVIDKCLVAHFNLGLGGPDWKKLESKVPLKIYDFCERIFLIKARSPLVHDLIRNFFISSSEVNCSAFKNSMALKNQVKIVGSYEQKCVELHANSLNMLKLLGVI